MMIMIKSKSAQVGERTFRLCSCLCMSLNLNLPFLSLSLV